MKCFLQFLWILRSFELSTWKIILRDIFTLQKWLNNNKRIQNKLKPQSDLKLKIITHKKSEIAKSELIKLTKENSFHLDYCCCCVFRISWINIICGLSHIVNSLLGWWYEKNLFCFILQHLVKWGFFRVELPHSHITFRCQVIVMLIIFPAQGEKKISFILFLYEKKIKGKTYKTISFLEICCKKFNV